MARGVLKVDPERSCDGKVRHASKEEARRAAGVMRRRTGQVLRPYKCHHCDGFHVGHRCHRGTPGMK